MNKKIKASTIVDTPKSSKVPEEFWDTGSSSIHNEPYETIDIETKYDALLKIAKELNNQNKQLESVIKMIVPEWKGFKKQ